MAKATTSEIAEYRSGSPVWQRDCASELHEFKYRCLEHLMTHDQDTNAPSIFPPSFSAALEAKQNWVQGSKDDSVLHQTIQAVMQDTGNWWPSNWCFGINAMFCARTVVVNALENDLPAPSTAQCAENLILFMGFSSACVKMDCRNNAETKHTENMCDDFDDEGMTVRGVDCPHISDPGIEETAKDCIDSTTLKWRKQLTEELTALITPKGGATA